MARWDAPRPLHWPVRAGRGPASQSHSPAAVCRAGQRLLACCWPSWDRCTTPQAWWSSWITPPPTPTLTPTQQSRCRSMFDAMVKSLFKLVFFTFSFSFSLFNRCECWAGKKLFRRNEKLFLSICSRGYSRGWRWRFNFVDNFHKLSRVCVWNKN